MSKILDTHADIREHMDILLTQVHRYSHITSRSSTLKASISSWVVPISPLIKLESRREILQLLTGLAETVEDEMEVIEALRVNLTGLVADLLLLCQYEKEMMQELEGLRQKVAEYEKREEL